MDRLTGNHKGAFTKMMYRLRVLLSHVDPGFNNIKDKSEIAEPPNPAHDDYRKSAPCRRQYQKLGILHNDIRELGREIFAP